MLVDSHHLKLSQANWDVKITLIAAPIILISNCVLAGLSPTPNCESINAENTPIHLSNLRT